MKNLSSVVFVLIVAISAADSEAGNFSDLFEKGDQKTRIVLCAPALSKFYAITSLSLGIKYRKGEDIAEAHKTAVNIGYRAEVFKLYAERFNPSLLKNAWEDSVELANISSEKNFSIISACVSLYNQLRTRGNFDTETEKKSIEKISKEVAFKLMKNR